MERNNQPLKGVRVLDFSRVIAGPMGTLILSDLGAAVVKVETPDGDEARRYGNVSVGGNRSIFLAYNRNKRSVVLDLRKAKGRELALRLAARSDVLVENFRPGVMDRLGLGYDTVRAANPRIVYCSISGYGQTGPTSHLPAFEAILQARVGVMSITGEEDGKPVRVGAPIVDTLAAVFAALNVISALYARREDGAGRRIDLSLLEGQIALMNPTILEYIIGGVVPARSGSASLYQAPSRAYPTATDDLMIMVGEGAWVNFCRVIGTEHLLSDPRFASVSLRVAHREALDAELSQALRAKSAEEWLGLLLERGIPCGPINTVDRVPDDPQVIARRALRVAVHPTYGPVPQVAPVAWRIWPAEEDPPAKAPPLLGEHTREVLAEYLELGAAEIDDLERAGIVKATAV